MDWDRNLAPNGVLAGLVAAAAAQNDMQHDLAAKLIAVAEDRRANIDDPERDVLIAFGNQIRRNAGELERQQKAIEAQAAQQVAAAKAEVAAAKQAEADALMAMLDANPTAISRRSYGLKQTRAAREVASTARATKRRRQMPAQEYFSPENTKYLYKSRVFRALENDKIQLSRSYK